MGCGTDFELLRIRLNGELMWTWRWDSIGPRLCTMKLFGNYRNGGADDITYDNSPHHLRIHTTNSCSTCPNNFARVGRGEVTRRMLATPTARDLPFSAPAVLCRPPADATARTKNERFFMYQFVYYNRTYNLKRVTRSEGPPRCCIKYRGSMKQFLRLYVLVHIIISQPLCSCILGKRTKIWPFLNLFQRLSVATMFVSFI
jgi:hypothetical protein